MNLFITKISTAALVISAALFAQPLAADTRETGATVTVKQFGDISVHSYLAPVQAFANNTHIIETTKSLVLIDTQFLLPMAMDFRAYADSLGKPIERVLITHEHPDHFLGSQAFADVDVYALAEVAAKIKTNGQTEIDEKSAQFGEAIATSFIIPKELSAGTDNIDGVVFEFEKLMNAEADVQLIIKLPEQGVIATGDIVYSGVHLILAGQPPTWIEALARLEEETAEFALVLPGHGATTDPSVYKGNIAWLTRAGGLLGTAKTGDEFKTGMVEAFPELTMDSAIDFIIPYVFPSK